MASSNDKYSDELCAERKWNGDPCRSRVVYGERVCHYHKVMGKPKVEINNSPSGHTYLPVFEDAVSIQNAISDVCEMMLHRRIEAKEASILLYAMQVASTNMAQLNSKKGRRKQKSPASSVPPTEAPPANNSPTLSSEPQRLPPGTIHACEPRRQAFE
ncbi:MAG: hypothetical protein WAU58_16690 [Terriglobales bacterium]